jgi:hypothetical protein
MRELEKVSCGVFTDAMVTYSCNTEDVKMEELGMFANY